MGFLLCFGHCGRESNDAWTAIIRALYSLWKRLQKRLKAPQNGSWSRFPKWGYIAPWQQAKKRLLASKVRLHGSLATGQKKAPGFHQSEATWLPGNKDVLFFMLISVKMPTIVGILTFMRMINFMLIWVEHEKGNYRKSVQFCPNS